MMRVVDTSAWIEWFLDSPTGKLVGPQVPPRDQFVVPTIVQFELAKWLRREISDQQADEVIALTDKCVVVVLSTSTAIRAAYVAQAHKLSAADAIIYATAQNHDAELLTCDAHFEGLPGVVYIAKNG